MAILRTRRYERYKKFRAENLFLPGEARPLSKVPFKLCPYIKEVFKDRIELRVAAEREAEAQGKALSLRAWASRVKQLYNANRWLKLDRRGKIVGDPWKMLRDYEDMWRQKHPQYDSPWEKRYKAWKGFWEKYERTIARQRGVR